jgi:hypothetical protein
MGVASVKRSQPLPSPSLSTPINGQGSTLFGSGCAYGQAGTGRAKAALHRHRGNILRSEQMKKLTTILAASMLATAAYAQTTVIEKRETAPSSTTIVKERTDPSVTVKKEVTTGSVGCESKTVQKTDSFGDSKTKTTVEC